MTFELPPLPYSYDALEPYIDTQTMHLHHDKHHATYVNNLNAALQSHPFANLPVEEVVRRLNEVPENIRTTVRNNVGGHVKHTMFWEIMTPGGSKEPTGELAAAINGKFGSLDAFKAALNDAGVKRFGSGWAWLILNKRSELEITSTANQDSPLMEDAFPILGNDVWEHAYYLKYQNRRPDYLSAWWNVVNWDQVGKRYARARAHNR
jgi:Fe-Mn family superoxide dismutase